VSGGLARTRRGKGSGEDAARRVPLANRQIPKAPSDSSASSNLIESLRPPPVRSSSPTLPRRSGCQAANTLTAFARAALARTDDITDRPTFLGLEHWQ